MGDPAGERFQQRDAVGRGGPRAALGLTTQQFVVAQAPDAAQAAEQRLAPESGLAGSRAMRRIVRSETPVSLAVRPCGTDAASNKGTSSRFLSEYTLSSRSREPSRGPPVREDTAERPESGSAEPAMISGTWAARFPGTRT